MYLLRLEFTFIQQLLSLDFIIVRFERNLGELVDTKDTKDQEKLEKDRKIDRTRNYKERNRTAKI